MSWETRAACRPEMRPDHLTPQEWTSIFFPENRQGATNTYAQARIICAGCPVRKACLEENIGEFYGFVGGTTPLERKRLRAGLGPRGKVHDGGQRIVNLARQGHGDAEIAGQTGLSVTTVRLYRRANGIIYNAGEPRPGR